MCGLEQKTGSKKKKERNTHNTPTHIKEYIVKREEGEEGKKEKEKAGIETSTTKTKQMNHSDVL